MGLWDRIRGGFRGLVEFVDDGRGALVHRFEGLDGPLLPGSELLVRQGQSAVLVAGGRIADVFGPGTHTLNATVAPRFAELAGWTQEESKSVAAEVYFVDKTRITDLKWGTKNPITLRDRDFGPVRVRAFGTYAVRVRDSAVFCKEIVGTDGRFTMHEISDQLRNVIVARFGDLLGESRIPVLELAANYDELGKLMHGRIDREFRRYGLDLTKLLIENVSLPPEVERALDARAGSAQIAPPPLPGAYHVAIGGKQSGPFEVTILRGMVARGEIERSTLVWRSGMPSWRAVDEVGELRDALFGSSADAPPPLPPE